MGVDLLSLLRRQSVAHPTRFTSAEFLDNGVFRVRVTGWPWWDDALDKSKDHEIELLFGGLGYGSIATGDFDFEETEALEVFDVVETASLPWTATEGFAIYCHAALPRPLDVFAKVHDALLPYADVRRAGHFLNCGIGESLSKFIEITASNSYLVARAPPVIRDLICAELAVQGVGYNELPTRLAPCGPLLITLGRSQFFCETAEASFLS